MRKIKARVRNTLYPRVKRKKVSNLNSSRLTRLRLFMRPAFQVFNRYYNTIGSKIDTVVFILIIASIPAGQFGNLLTPIIIYYSYIVLLVCWRIFMHWDYFYTACRMIALKIELGLTKGKGFKGEFAGNK